MNIIQSYYTLSNKDNGAELIFLFNTGLSRLINKLSLISNKNLLVPWAKMVKLSNERLWLQKRRWSRIELSADGLTFLLVNGEMPMCSPESINFFAVKPADEFWLVYFFPSWYRPECKTWFWFSLQFHC